MASPEDRARELGLARLHLDTASNQPEALAFYRALNYQELGTEHHPDWAWTLVYFGKDLTSPPERRPRPYHRGDGDAFGI